jgi:hypothetical protein
MTVTDSTTAPPVRRELDPAARVGIWQHDLRRMVLPPEVPILDGLLPVGAVLLYAPPGLGKTFLAEVIEHHLAYGTPLRGWPEPEQLTRCLVYDAESSLLQMQQRSWSITNYLETDDLDPAATTAGPWAGAGGIRIGLEELEGRPGFPGRTATERFLHLRAELTEARDRGMPYRYVRIDTMRMFIGARPHGMDIVTFENQWSVNFNHLAEEFGCCIVLLHHTNKASEYSGSTGLGGGVSLVVSMSRNPDNEREIVLKSEDKNRKMAAFSYALMQNSDGVPQFTDLITPTQASMAGTNRAVIDLLTKQPRTMAELYSRLSAMPNTTVRRCVQRLQRGDGVNSVIRYRKGRYEVCGQEPAGPDYRATRLCVVCREAMTVVEEGQRTHPSCEEVPGPSEAGEPEGRLPSGGGDQEAAGPDTNPEPTPGKWNAFTELDLSVSASVKHPVSFIKPEARDQGVWPLFTANNNEAGESMVGLHRWAAEQLPVDVAGDALVAVLDRHGSFPAVCSSVTVAPNLLHHTGPLDEYDPKMAGAYRLAPLMWSDRRIGHPLGPIALKPDDEWWITTPHLRLLVKLHRAGRIGRPIILDSWTGKAAGGLFQDFSVSVREQRIIAARESEAAYNEVKDFSSIALRSLWCSTESRFWRPDWSVSIRAESQVRLWAVSYAALGPADQPTGAVLLRLRNTDESWWLAPAGSTDTWAPAGLKMGPGFGQVSHKHKVPIGRGKDKTTVPSPLTLAQYQDAR